LKTVKQRGAPLLVAATALVTVSFVGASLYTLWLGRRVHAEAAELRTNAAPSVERLVVARNRLLELSTCVGEVAADRQAALRCVRSVRGQIELELDAYRALPDYPGENALYMELRRDLAGLDRRLDQSVARWSKAAPDAHELAIDTTEIFGAIRLVDEELGHLSTFNVAHASAHAGRIEEHWRSAVGVELILDGVCVVLAVIATMITVRALRRYTRFLEERSKELEMFAARVAHDVMGPLAAVGLTVPLLGEQNLDDVEAQRAVKRALAALSRVRALVDGILEFASSGARPRAGRADVHAVVDGVIADAGDVAARARVTIDVEPFAPVETACSPGVLTSILSNLVRNAIKYMGSSEARRVVVRVIPRRGDVRFEVVDTGQGVAPELHEHIFEPYARVASGGQPGLGLGLATVKRFVVAHGGAVGVRSEIGRGALFWFQLPLAAPQQPIAPAPPA
jgi:signal transduction histidine kinase